MAVFGSRAFDNHEQVAFFCDPDSGLRAIIAIHNTNRGPALGGCRMWPYTSEDEAIRDVLRLSRGMTYKSAVSNLNLGGGKAVIIGNARTDKTPELLHAMGRAVHRLGGRYIVAEDVGTSVEDIRIIGEQTAHVAGIVDKQTRAGGMRSGDPSPATAHGAFFGLRAAVKYKLGTDDLQGLKVAVQGVGNVGYRLAKQLHEAGAKLWVSDIYEDNLLRAAETLGATIVGADDIYGLDVDVFAPCALGAVINDATLPQLRAKVVAGAANNQLSEDRHGKELMGRGILYAPDYVINAGGIIDISYERGGSYDRDAAVAHMEGIYDTLIEIFERSAAEGLPTNLIADFVAEERFRKK
jgi:leucine dehydrogenase